MEQNAQERTRLLRLIPRFAILLLVWLAAFTALAVSLDRISIQLWAPAVLALVLLYGLLIGASWNQYREWVLRYIRRNVWKFILIILLCAAVTIALSQFARSAAPDVSWIGLLPEGLSAAFAEILVLFYARSALLQGED